MTTIAQLTPVVTVGASDLLPLSQAGLLYSASVAQLTAGLQPSLSLPTGSLLGRHSTGAGAPETITLGAGLALGSAGLQATGADHAGFPVQATLALADDVVISANNAPALLPVIALRGLFSSGPGITINASGIISATATGATGPAGPQGPAGPAGPPGAVGAAGPAGVGLSGPTAGNSASAVGASDYVALWQSGALAWIPYGQFLGGQTIDELPGAAPVSDSDQMLVAQGSNSLNVQSFGSVWSYLQAKLPSVQNRVVELTGNTVLDATEHNRSILVASAALTLTANFSNTGAGFSCVLINLAPGPVTMGVGISSGSGGTVLPPGAETTLVGLSYSGGSLVWWSGVVPNAPTITVGSIAAPAPNAAFSVSGGIFNDAPTALDYSIDGGTTWIAAPSPVITANAYSFTVPGLVAGTYALRVRDHANPAVLGVSNNFVVVAPSVGLGAIPGSIPVNSAILLSGTVVPANAAVQVGLSSSATVAPGGFVNATVTNGSWTASVTPAVGGTAYVWAEQQASPSVLAVSSAINVVAASLTVTAPTTASLGSAVTVSGTVSPGGDIVNVQLAAQNNMVPASGWTAVTAAAGAFTASLTPAAAGTIYAWAQDPATGLTAVSGAISVSAAPALTFGINNPGGTYTHGVSTIPLNGPITPAQNVATQVALSTSATVAPTTGWAAASVIYGNALWAIYYTTPPTAGTYYVWVQTAAGTNSTVSSFTVTVT